VVKDAATLVVIGGGNMGAALVQGMLREGRTPGNITIVEVSEARRQDLVRMFPGVGVASVVPSCSDVIVAVKPAQVAEACASAAAVGASRVMSIAAGVTIAAIERASGEGVRVIRAMPNTPAVVGMAATAISVSAACTDADREWARELMECVGMVIELDESMLDAFTGLVGSGPAYVFYLAESLKVAAMAEGFDVETSAGLVAQLLSGSAALLQREPQHARQLRERVTSPNGTTAAGIAVLDAQRVHDALVAAVRSAAARSKELGDA
jgi:pyrroline-5-carboxylate reductase